MVFTAGQEGIVLDDGRQHAPWLKGLTNRPLTRAVVYFTHWEVNTDLAFTGG